MGRPTVKPVPSKKPQPRAKNVAKCRKSHPSRLASTPSMSVQQIPQSLATASEMIDQPAEPMDVSPALNQVPGMIESKHKPVQSHQSPYQVSSDAQIPANTSETCMQPTAPARNSIWAYIMRQLRRSVRWPRTSTQYIKKTSNRKVTQPTEPPNNILNMVKEAIKYGTVVTRPSKFFEEKDQINRARCSEIREGIPSEPIEVQLTEPQTGESGEYFGFEGDETMLNPNNQGRPITLQKAMTLKIDKFFNKKRSIHNNMPCMASNSLQITCKCRTCRAKKAEKKQVELKEFESDTSVSDSDE